MDDLTFVAGARWHRSRCVTVQVMVRERRKASDGSGGDAEARKLTSKMTDVTSATELLNLLDGVVEHPIFNHFHASAAYHRLATLKRRDGLTQNEISSPVLPRLAARVEDMAVKGQLEARSVANVLWSLGQLSDGPEAPTGLLATLVGSTSKKAAGMNPQHLSNTLLACVQLKGVAPVVLGVIPEIAPQILAKAKDMSPQALSNSLWAAAHLKDDAAHEDVAKIVSGVGGQIPVQATDLIPQQLSNILWAAAQLKDIAPDIKEMLVEMLPAIATQIRGKAKNMNPQALSNSLLAAARLKDDVFEVPQMLPALLEEVSLKQANFYAQDFSNCLDAFVLLEKSVPEIDPFFATNPGSKNDFVRFTARRFSSLLPNLKGSDLKFGMPIVVWFCARINFYHHELLAGVAKRMGSRKALGTLTDWGVCVLLWSFEVLDPDARVFDFKHTLKSEIRRRKLSESDVSESRLGHFAWKCTKG